MNDDFCLHLFIINVGMASLEFPWSHVESKLLTFSVFILDPCVNCPAVAAAGLQLSSCYVIPLCVCIIRKLVADYVSEETCHYPQTEGLVRT